MSRFLNRFSRPPSGSPRRPAARAAAEPPVAIALDRWLDAQMPGRSTPGTAIDPADSLSGADRSAFASLAGTFRRIDRLDVGATDGADDRLQARLWEDIMQATLPTQFANPAPMPLVGSSSAPASPPLPPRVRPLDRPSSRTGGFARLSPVLNVAMAALLVLVLGLSAWAVTGHRPGGSGEGPGGTEVPAALGSLAAPSSEATLATPDGSPVAHGIMPTADECTIQPLTIDQVMERLEPWLQSYAGVGKSTHMAPPWIPVNLTPIVNFDSIPEIVYPVSTSTPTSAAPIDLALSDITEVQRQVMACFVAQDPFRIWALIAPDASYWSFLAWSLLQRTDAPSVRGELEALEGKTGSERMTWLTMQGYGIVNRMPLVNPDPAASAYGMNGTTPVIRVATLAYDVNHPERLPRAMPIDQTYQTWLYVYDNASKRWLVDNIGDFGPAD